MGDVTSDWDPGDPSPYLVIGLGILVVVASMRHVIAIEKAGRDAAMTMPIYEGGKAKRVVEALTQGMYQDANKTDLGLHGNPGFGQPPAEWTPQQPPQPPQG